MRLMLTLIAAPLLAGCLGPPDKEEMPPFTGPDDIAAMEHLERRTWGAANEIDEEIALSGAIYEDEQLRLYLQGVRDRLYPEFQGHIRVHVLQAPVLNAFCIANGSVYMNSGIIARMWSRMSAWMPS